MYCWMEKYLTEPPYEYENIIPAGTHTKGSIKIWELLPRGMDNLPPWRYNAGLCQAACPVKDQQLGDAAGQ